MTTTYDVSSESALNGAIQAVDKGPAGNYVINITGPIDLTSELLAINLPNASTLTIEGTDSTSSVAQVQTIDGQGRQRGLFVYSGNVTIENLTLQNMTAQGGAGAEGGGGGAGLGGGLFVAGTAGGGGHDPGQAEIPDVTLVNVAFSNDAAVGGNGAMGGTAFAGGGGGGLGGSGGELGSAGGGGGGGVGSGQGSPGIIVGAPPGGAGPFGRGTGGPSGGGGGSGGSGGGGGGGVGGSAAGVSSTGAVGDYGGAGGFGGGGGGGGRGPIGVNLLGMETSSGGSTGFGGAGGFGGGGGAASHGAGGGDGGFGGGGGGGSSVVGFGGFGGGVGGVGGDGGDFVYGGGGLGAGGDIFVQQGATLSIDGGSLSDGSVTGGKGATGGAITFASGNGSAFGSGLFLQGNGTLTLAPGAGQTESIADVITDQTGSGGFGANAGSWGLVLDGAGTLVLTALNTYSGGTTIDDGTLQLGASGALGQTTNTLTLNGGELDLGATSQITRAVTLDGGSIENGTLNSTAYDLAAGTVSAALDGSAALTKTGSGTVTLLASDFYSGGTTINAGALELGSGGSITGDATFADAGVPETLRLDTGTNQLGGSIGGFAFNDDLDLGFVDYSSALSAVWQENGGNTGGTLALDDNGSTLASLKLSGQYDSSNFSLASDGHGGTTIGFDNTPTVIANNPTVDDGQTVAVDPIIFTVNGSGISEYEVWFSAANQGAPALGAVSNNGSAVALNQGVYLTSLSGLDYTGGPAAGTDEMWLRAYNGSWSSWVQADITDPGGSGPVAVTANNPTVLDGQSVAVDPAVFSVGGSGISQYEVWFSAANQGAPALGSVTENGTAIALNQGVYLNSLAGLNYTGGATAGTDEMWLRAYDGTWSSWVQADITDPGNVAPPNNPGITPATVTANNPTVTDGQTVAVDPTVFTVSGSGVTKYEVWFSAANQGAPVLGSVTDNGNAIALNQGVYLTTLNGLDYTGGATAGTDEMWLRAYDGNWSGWVQADITDPGSAGAPAAQTTRAVGNGTLLNGAAADQQVDSGAFDSGGSGDAGSSALWSGTGSAGWLTSYFASYQSAGAMMAGSASSVLSSAPASDLDGAPAPMAGGTAGPNQANLLSSLDPIGGAGTPDVLQMQSLMAPPSVAPGAQLQAPTFAVNDAAPIFGAGLLQHA